MGIRFILILILALFLAVGCNRGSKESASVAPKAEQTAPVVEEASNEMETEEVDVIEETDEMVDEGADDSAGETAQDAPEATD